MRHLRPTCVNETSSPVSKAVAVAAVAPAVNVFTYCLTHKKHILARDGHGWRRNLAARLHKEINHACLLPIQQVLRIEQCQNRSLLLAVSTIDPAQHGSDKHVTNVKQCPTASVPTWRHMRLQASCTFVQDAIVALRHADANNRLHLDKLLQSSWHTCL